MQRNSGRLARLVLCTKHLTAPNCNAHLALLVHRLLQLPLKPDHSPLWTLKAPQHPSLDFDNTMHL